MQQRQVPKQAEASDSAPIHLRAIRPEDAEQLCAMMNLPGIRAGTLQAPFQSVAGTRQWIENFSSADLHIVALIDDMIVGNAGLRRQSGRRHHCGSLGMGVHDDQWGRGIGTALMGALVDAADNWLNIRRLELTVFTDNAAAIHLYGKFGFETEGTLRGYAFRAGKYADVHTMARIRK